MKNLQLLEDIYLAENPHDAETDTWSDKIRDTDEWIFTEADFIQTLGFKEKISWTLNQ